MTAGQPYPAAVILDLDRCVIDSSRAWRYTIEEAAAFVTGRRLDASGLVQEYSGRPWRHALTILLSAEVDIERAEIMCRRIAASSALKRITVFQGIPTALDRLQLKRAEIGAISRLDHQLALKQIQSAGLDRFLSVLAAAADGRFDVQSQLQHCLNFLRRAPHEAVFVSPDAKCLTVAETVGVRCQPILQKDAADTLPGRARTMPPRPQAATDRQS